MGKPAVGGISGVLGGLIAAPPQPVRKTVEIPAAEVRQVVPRPRDENVVRSRTARRGRPPGRTTGSVENKSKVTLRIDARLMDDYREWSWTARCQLGELVERALEHYRNARR